MSHPLTVLRLASIAAAIILGVSPAHAQISGSSGVAGSAPARSGSAMTTQEDQKMFADIAHAHLAEIETGKLALEKAGSEQVKQFAQKMIDEHTAALQELQALAQRKNVGLPAEPDLMHKTLATALRALSGETFDKQYIARVGVGDHQRTHELLQKVVDDAKDPDLKAYAQKTIKAVDSHLAAAKKMEGK